MMTFNEQIGKRIADLLASHNMKQVDLVNAGCAKSAHMSHIIKGTTGVSLPVLDLICRTIGVSLSEFFQPFAASAPRLPQYVSELYCICSELSPDDVKVLKIAAERMKAIRNESSRKPEQKKSTYNFTVVGEAAAGFPVYSPADWDDDRIVVPEKYADPDRFFPIRARGDSMEPRIHSGDVVIVQKDVPPENGEVALVRLAGLADDEYTIKRVYLSNGVMTLRSYNPAYPPMIYGADEVRSCERIVHILHRA